MDDAGLVCLSESIDLAKAPGRPSGHTPETQAAGPGRGVVRRSAGDFPLLA